MKKRLNPKELIIAEKKAAIQNEEVNKHVTQAPIPSFNIEHNKDEGYIGHLAAIVEFSDDAIVSQSFDGIIKSWNKGGEKMFGYTAKEAVGKHISLIIPLEYIEDEKAIIQRIRNNEIIDHYETMRSKKDGEQLYVSLTVSPLKDAKGTIIGVSKIIRDITFRKRTEVELMYTNNEFIFQHEEKEKRAAELIIANQELTFQNEEKGKRAAELVIANKELAFQNLEKEKRAEELIIANKELAFQNREKEKRAAELAIANEELAFQNAEKEKRAGELIIANKELAHQNQEKGKRAAELIIANQELTFQNEEKEKRAAELVIANEELAFQNKEKEERAAELFTANKELSKAKLHIVELNIGLEQKIVERTAQLEAANKELESFSYSVSHDLRSPLRAINGFTQVLAEDYADKFDEEGRSVIEEIISNSDRMGELIDNLLEFSHIGKQNLCMANVHVKEMLETIITELKQLEPLRKILVTIQPLDNIKGDRNLLRQVFINLISNAFKYTGKIEKATVEIGSYQDNTSCTFYVKDNGAGFDMLYYDKLFGVFQRLHSNSEFEGTGVGLAIIQRIVSKHGGKVWAEAKVDEGACFYVSLPKA